MSSNSAALPQSGWVDENNQQGGVGGVGSGVSKSSSVPGGSGGNSSAQVHPNLGSAAESRPGEEVGPSSSMNIGASSSLLGVKGSKSKKNRLPHTVVEGVRHSGDVLAHSAAQGAAHVLHGAEHVLQGATVVSQKAAKIVETVVPDQVQNVANEALTDKTGTIDTRTREGVQELLVRWLLGILPWVILTWAISGLTSVGYWSDKLNQTFEQTTCATDGYAHPRVCSTYTVPLLLLAVVFSLSSLVVDSSVRLRVLPGAVAGIAIILSVVLFPDEAGIAPVRVVSPPLSCSGWQAIAECTGDWVTYENGTEVKVARVDCEPGNCEYRLLELSTMTLETIMSEHLGMAGVVPPPECWEQIRVLMVSPSALQDVCTDNCQRVPRMCKSYCTRRLAECDPQSAQFVLDYIRSSGVVQGSAGEMPMNATGRPVYSRCLLQALENLATSCESLPECGVPRGQCALEDIPGFVPPEDFELRYEVPTSDTRPDSLKNYRSRQLFLTAAVPLVVLVGWVNYDLLAHTLGGSRKEVHAWLDKHLEGHSISDHLSKFNLLVMFCAVGASVMTIISMSLASVRIEAAIPPGAGTFTWQRILLTFICLYLSVFTMNLSKYFRRWRPTASRLALKEINGALTKHVVWRGTQWTREFFSPSSGRWFVFITMMGDVAEVVSQGTSILSSSEVTDYYEIVRHCLILFASLSLGTLCMVLAVVYRNNTFCIAKMIVDTAGDITYMFLSYYSTVFATSLGVAIGFFIPAFLLGVRCLSMIKTNFEFTRAKLLLEFVRAHKGHPEYDKSNFDRRLLIRWSDTVEKVATVKNLSAATPSIVLIVYTILIGIVVSWLNPPGGQLAVCQWDVGGARFHAPIEPKVVTGRGLLSDPKCSYGPVDTYELRGKGLRDADLPASLFRALSSASSFRRLDLSGNRLTQIPDGLQGFLALEVLDLSGNDISWLDLSRLPSNAARDARNFDDILDLRLGGNPVAERVDIADQVIGAAGVPKGFGRWLSGAKVLIARNTSLVTLGEEETKHMLHLEEIDVSQNPEYVSAERYPSSVFRINQSHCAPFSDIGAFLAVSGVNLEAAQTRADHFLDLRGTLMSPFNHHIGLYKVTQDLTFHLDREVLEGTDVRLQLDSCLAYTSDTECKVPGVPGWIMSAPPAKMGPLILDSFFGDAVATPGLVNDLATLLSAASTIESMNFFGSIQGARDAFGDQWATLIASLSKVQRSISFYEAAGESGEPDPAVVDELLQTYLSRAGSRFIRCKRLDYVLAGLSRALQLPAVSDNAELISMALFNRSPANGTSCALDPAPCLTAVLPASVYTLEVSNMKLDLRRTFSNIYRLIVTRSYLLVDPAVWHSMLNLANPSLYDVETNDWLALGRLIAFSHRLGVPVGSDAHRKWRSYEEGTQTLLLGNLQPSDYRFEFINSRHREGHIVSSLFFAGFNDALLPIPLTGASVFTTGVTFEGFQVGINLAWMVKHHRLTYRHGSFVDPWCFYWPFAFVGTAYNYLEEIELINNRGDISSSWSTFQWVAITDWDETSAADPAYMDGPYTLKKIHVEKADNPAGTLPWITMCLPDFFPMANVVELYLNEMDVTDAEAKAILDALAQREQNTKPVDLHLRSSAITNETLLHAQALLESERLCLSSLNLDVAYVSPPDSPYVPQYDVEQAAAYVVAAARSNWCRLVAFHVPLAVEEEVLALVRGAFGSNTTEVAMATAAERAIRLEDGPSLQAAIMDDFYRKMVLRSPSEKQAAGWVDPSPLYPDRPPFLHREPLTKRPA